MLGVVNFMCILTEGIIIEDVGVGPTGPAYPNEPEMIIVDNVDIIPTAPDISDIPFEPSPPIITEPPPIDPRCEIPSFKCYRNGNGMCRFFKTPCEAENSINRFGYIISKYEP